MSVKQGAALSVWVVCQRRPGDTAAKLQVSSPFKRAAPIADELSALLLSYPAYEEDQLGYGLASIVRLP
jgi:hypothetical protein